MKKPLKLSIRKKVFLLTASLSLLLIIASVVLSSFIFMFRTRSDARKMCTDASVFTAEFYSDEDTERLEFIKEYKEKLDAIYRENVEEIEKYAKNNYEIELKERKKFFEELTASIFVLPGSFGVYPEKLAFQKNYDDMIESMTLIAEMETGMIHGCLVYYDAERNNIVYMADTYADTYFDYNYPCSVEKADQDMIDNVFTGTRPKTYFRDNVFIGYAPIVDENGENIAYVGYYYSINNIINGQHEFLFIMIGTMVAASVVILIIYLVIANKSIVKNVTTLSKATVEFTSNLSAGEELKTVKTDIKTNDEIGVLSENFNTLQSKVVEYAQDIAERQITEGRMRAELNIASKIQMQSLPDKPIIINGARISSFIRPAKEVGGDLFDYFVTDDNKLFFVIADVSGKGVPAALFMMRGKEIIRSCANAGMSAGKIAQTANAALCVNNSEGLFITAFIGTYDTKDKKLTYVRAGHEQPYIVRKGKAEKFGEESNFVLGAFENTAFVEETIKLNDGDRILFYTDGLNEGINENNEEFGYERIKEVLETENSDILATMYEKAVEFAGDVEQFDDITMLLFESVKSDSITLKSPTFDDIPTVTDRINSFVKGLNGEKIAELDIVIDEMMNNYISYAFEDVKKPQLDIDVRLLDGSVELTFTDNGKLFNPLDKEDADVDAGIIDRPIGGMGIMIVKRISDNLSYRVFEGKNRLIITKNLKG